MLKPEAPPGRPQPSIRSSMSCGSSCGTLSSAARTAVTARSSGRTSFSEPLNARLIGVRAVATITASGMGSSFVRRAEHRRAGHNCGVVSGKTLPDKLLAGKGVRGGRGGRVCGVAPEQGLGSGRRRRLGGGRAGDLPDRGGQRGEDGRGGRRVALGGRVEAIRAEQF